MATVARVTGPSVAPDALPGVRLTSRLDSGYADGIARGLGQMGQVAQDIAQREKDQADAASLLEARRKLSDWERGWFDPENPQGVYARKGRDAAGLQDDVAPDFERVSNELASGLRDDRVRFQFLQMAEAQRESVLGRVQQHAVREHEMYVDSEFKATVASTADMAGRAALEGRTADQLREVSMGLQTIRAQAVLNGEPAELTRVREQEYMSTVHTTAVTGFLATGRIDDAIRYYDENSDDMTAAAATELQSKMNPQLLESMADRVEASITSGSPMPAGVAEMQGAAGTIKEAESVAVASVGRTISLESRGNATAKNPRSSATGAGQFLSGTWVAMVGKYAPHLAQGKTRTEVLALRTDPDLSRTMAEAYAKENARFLFQSGLPVTQETVYLAHRFGPGGAAKLLRAAPDAPVASVVSSEVLAANPDLKGKTIAELSASHSARAGEPAGGSGGGGGGSTMPALVVTGRTSAEAMREHAKTVPNVLLRKTLEQRADKLEAQAERDQRDYERAMTDSIWQKVGAAEGRARPSAILTPDELVFARDNRLLGPIAAEQHRKLTGALVQDDPELVQHLQTLALDHPQRFKSLNLGKYATALSPSTRSEFTKLQADIDKPAKQAEVSSDAQRVASMSRALGFDRLEGRVKEQRQAGLNAYWLMAKKSYVAQHNAAPIGKDADELMARVQRQFLENPDLGRGARMAELLSTSPQDAAVAREKLRARYGRDPSAEEVRSWLDKYYAAEAKPILHRYPELAIPKD